MNEFTLPLREVRALKRAFPGPLPWRLTPRTFWRWLTDRRPVKSEHNGDIASVAVPNGPPRCPECNEPLASCEHVTEDMRSYY